MSIDFARIMADPIGSVTTTCDPGTWAHHVSSDEARVMASLALAATVVDLCPDCHGKGEITTDPESWAGCTHPDAPSIGKLLAIGAAVMTATTRKGGTAMHGTVYVNDTRPGFTQARTLLEALRAVGDD